MSYNAVILPVMIASPGDVAQERAVARDVINHWNYAHSGTRKAVLMPMGWETHTSPELGTQSAQGLINTRVLEHCDLLVGIFWTRLGTPTENAASGSAEEIERHLAAGKPALVYFSDKMVAPGMLDAEQYEELKKFKSWCFSRGLVETFDSVESFRIKLSHQLNITMNQNPFISELLSSNSIIEQGSSHTATLTNEATRLLRAAVAEGGHGQLTKLSYIGGMSISAGNESFAGDGSPRELAKWLHGFDELVTYGLIEDVGYQGEIFRVTERGYQAIEGAEAAAAPKNE